MPDDPLANTATTDAPDWSLDSVEGTLAPRSALEVLTSLNERIAPGKIDQFQPIATGFVPLDKTIGGGVRPHPGLPLPGRQGSGTNPTALQLARHMAAGGQASALYVRVEHE